MGIPRGPGRPGRPGKPRGPGNPTGPGKANGKNGAPEWKNTQILKSSIFYDDQLPIGIGGTGKIFRFFRSVVERFFRPYEYDDGASCW